MLAQRDVRVLTRRKEEAPAEDAEVFDDFGARALPPVL
jgi:hypothetical protein